MIHRVSNLFQILTWGFTFGGFHCRVALSINLLNYWAYINIIKIIMEKTTITVIHNQRLINLPKRNIKIHNSKLISYILRWFRLEKIHEVFETDNSITFQYFVQSINSRMSARTFLECYTLNFVNYSKSYSFYRAA